MSWWNRYDYLVLQSWWCTHLPNDFHNLITEAAHRDNSLITNFFRMKKAFDRAPLTCLLPKRRSYRVTGSHHVKFGSYLWNRFRLVSIVGHKSCPAPVISGVITRAHCYFPFTLPTFSLLCTTATLSSSLMTSKLYAISHTRVYHSLLRISPMVWDILANGTLSEEWNSRISKAHIRPFETRYSLEP